MHRILSLEHGLLLPGKEVSVAGELVDLILYILVVITLMNYGSGGEGVIRVALSARSSRTVLTTTNVALPSIRITGNTGSAVG